MIGRFLLALAMLLAPAAAWAEEAAPPAADIEVVRTADGWTADYRLNHDARHWVFQRSALDRISNAPWRPTAWTILTPGVSLRRVGAHDVLAADDGGMLPRHLRFRVRPYSRDLLADYDPTLTFTNGAQALFTGHFDIAPVREGVDLAPVAYLEDSHLLASGTRMVLRSPGGRVRAHGRVLREASADSSDPTYVLFGSIPAIDRADSVAIVDPQLPAWISAQLGSEIPRLFAFYAQRLGERSGAKPTVMASWAGPTPNLRSMGGSVIGDIVVMRLEGVGVVEESDSIRRSVRQFLAHEGAHFWVGQTVGYESPRDGWLTEGAADLLSIRAIGALDPDYDQKAELNALLGECVELLPEGPITTAPERNKVRTNYACGAMIGLVAEAAARRTGGDFFSFWRSLIDANRTDKVVTMNEWLIHLSGVSGDRSLARDIRSLLLERTADPAAALASLFDRAGIAHARDANGKLVLQ